MKNNKILLYLIILISIILCIPSVIYLIINGTVDGFDSYYTYTLSRTENEMINITSGILVIGLFLLFSILYLLIIKKEESIFKDKKQVMTFIIIVSFIFMMILPYLSSDIYYYIGDSWLCSKYHQNPYYTTVKDLQDNGINDEILNNTGHWKYTTSIYGPVWNAISIGLVSLSFGSVTAALFIFKIASLLIHICNCYIIGKLTKGKKYILLYGLNPLILIELLSNVHNDIYLILFFLLSLYFLIKKKNIYLTVLFLVLSITIKYSTVLIIPFILLYYFRKESIFKRLCYCSIAGVIIVLCTILLYMPFYRDISIFTNMLVQDGKFTQSIMALLMVKMKDYQFVFNVINHIKLPILAIMYLVMLVKMLLRKKLSFKYVMNSYNIIMLMFIIFCLTTFQKWYVLWLIPTIIWKNKYMRYFILNLTITAIIPSYNYFKIENDAFSEGIYYSLIIIVLSLALIIIKTIYDKVVYRMNNNKRKKKNIV